MNNYGKAVKKKLVDLEKEQKWLIAEVRKKTGLYLDDSYLSKIFSGKRNAPNIVDAINEILGIE